MSDQGLLQVQDLHVEFRTRRGAALVLNGVSFEVNPGETLCVVGESGCGKSTLLRMIAGLEEVTSGAITIGGREVTHLSPRDRDIAMVFQNYALYPHMTVRDNMSFALMLAKVPKAQIEQRLVKAAE
ncbi:MAG: ATP-binding cassette domain-containing protein, partial [Gammaproteobacteria bacterium]